MYLYQHKLNDIKLPSIQELIKNFDYLVLEHYVS